MLVLVSFEASKEASPGESLRSFISLQGHCLTSEFDLSEEIRP